MTKSTAARSLSLFLALALSLLFLQPNKASADTFTYTLTKTLSSPFTCGSAPTPFTGFSQAQSAQPGQCVAVHVAITNSSDGPAITNLQLGDALPATLIGQTNSCIPLASGSYTCTVDATTFAFDTKGATYSLPAGATGAENFIVKVSPGAVCGSKIDNTATATAKTDSTTFTQSTPGAATATLTVACSYTLAKTLSAPFTCSSPPGTFTGLSQTQTAAPGQCVAVRMEITNSATNTLPITNLQLIDTLPTTLLEQGGTCGPRANLLYTCTIIGTTVTFNTNGASYSLAPGQTGTETFVAQVAPGTLCNSVINNTATASATNGATTFTQTNVEASTASLTVSCPATPQTYTVAKTFSTSFPCNAIPASATFSQSQVAGPGQCVAVRIVVANSSSSTMNITGISIGDALPANLAACSNPSAACTLTTNNFGFTTNSTTVTPGYWTTVNFIAQVSPNAACGSIINNTATATATNGATTFTQVNGSAATASLTVACTPAPVVYPTAFTVCGPITALVTTGAYQTMTVGGVIIPIATGATISVSSGVTFAIGATVCVRVLFNGAGLANVILVGVNAPGLPLICGVYTLSSTIGFILVGGVAVPVASNFMAGLPTGFTYCFLLTNGVCFTYLVTIPTSIKSLHQHRHLYRDGFTRPE